MKVSVDSWRKNGFDANSSIGEMPRFVDASAGDFHLADGSVGIDAGKALPEKVPADIDGTSRPQGSGWDCGCYEKAAVAE